MLMVDVVLGGCREDYLVVDVVTAGFDAILGRTAKPLRVMMARTSREWWWLDGDTGDRHDDKIPNAWWWKRRSCACGQANYVAVSADHLS